MVEDEATDRLGSEGSDKEDERPKKKKKKKKKVHNVACGGTAAC
jgi:hypothetical protein